MSAVEWNDLWSGPGTDYFDVQDAAGTDSGLYEFDGSDLFKTNDSNLFTFESDVLLGSDSHLNLFESDRSSSLFTFDNDPVGFDSELYGVPITVVGDVSPDFVDRAVYHLEGLESDAFVGLEEIRFGETMSSLFRSEMSSAEYADFVEQNGGVEGNIFHNDRPWGAYYSETQTLLIAEKAKSPMNGALTRMPDGKLDKVITHEMGHHVTYDLVTDDPELFEAFKQDMADLSARDPQAVEAMDEFFRTPGMHGEGIAGLAFLHEVVTEAFTHNHGIEDQRYSTVQLMGEFPNVEDYLIQLKL